MNHDLQVSILKELMQQLDDGKNIDAGVQYKMETSGYVCPDLAAKEWQIFFRNHPQLIGLSGDLPEPGSFITRDDFGTPVLATRDSDGQFHAFLNACRHRGVRVAQDERGKKKNFICPFHAWTYANTGQLKAVSDAHDFGDVDKKCMSLIELPAIERHGMLWVHPKPDGELDIDKLLGAELCDEIASQGLDQLVHGGDKTITMNLNWKFANDTFGESYHFGKLHKDTLAKLFHGNNLHMKEFGRHHRFVTASRAIDQFKTLPESQWNIRIGAAFVIYYLFPNIQLIVSNGSCTVVKIYPDPKNPGRSTSQICAYFAQEVVDNAAAAEAHNGAEMLDADSAYSGGGAAIQTLASTMEVFNSTVEQEDYLMGEYQQKSAESGVLKEIIFGRNEPLLHHMHKSYREALNLPALQKVES